MRFFFFFFFLMRHCRDVTVAYPVKVKERKNICVPQGEYQQETYYDYYATIVKCFFLYKNHTQVPENVHWFSVSRVGLQAFIDHQFYYDSKGYL